MKVIKGEGAKGEGQLTYFTSERQVESIGLRYSKIFRWSSCGRARNGVVSLGNPSHASFDDFLSRSLDCGSEVIVSGGSC
jgi:hypothetical protein